MFLKASQSVVPTLAHDYAEWHKGRTNFSLWYIKIQQPELLEYLQHLKDAFSDFLYTPNTRQFHITLFICGFLNQVKPNALACFDDDFSHQNLAQQISDLSQQFHTHFQLKTGKINSFESALFIEIDDPNGYLKRIRDVLYQSSVEIAPLDYCPHITLGLYKDEILSDVVFEKIAQIEQFNYEFQVNQLTFGTYQSQVIQGPLSPYYQHNLGE